MVHLDEIIKRAEVESHNFRSISVNKPLEVDLDVGSLLAFDPNILDKKLLDTNKNEYILSLTRDNVQLLFNQVWELPTERVEEAIVVKLPPPTYVLPRSKPVPKPKPLTKWQQFAKEKGINKKKKTKLTWDDQLKKWVPRFGFKKVKADKEKSWVLEVPGNADPMEDQFEKRKIAKGERIAKNELQRLRNIAKAKNVKVPRFGILDPEKSSSKDLQAALTISRSSTASLGKFQDKLPHEKEARGVSDITPGASKRKRKLPPMSMAEESKGNMMIVDSILNKRPKLNINEAVNRRVHTEQIMNSSSKKNSKTHSKKKNSKMASKKGPKKGGGGGRKRR